MKKLGTLTAAVVILGLAAMTGITWAQQMCPNPNVCAGHPECCVVQPVALLAYESVPHNSPIFRVLTDTTGVVDMVTILNPPVAANGAKVNYSVTIGTLPPLSFSAKTKQKKWTSTSHGDCFTISVSGFEDPKGTTDITDFVGVHTINVNTPAFLCGDPQNSPLICFQDKEISCMPTPSGGTCLPPNTDRNEDVCATATVM